MLIFIRNQHLAIGREYFNLPYTIAGIAELGSECALSTTKRIAGDTNCRTRPQRDRQVKRLGRVIQFMSEDTCIDLYQSGARNYRYPFHQGEVDNHTAIADAVTSKAVPPTAYSNCQIIMMCKFDGALHILASRAASNHYGEFFHCAVPYLPRIQITEIARKYDLARKTIAQFT